MNTTPPLEQVLTADQFLRYWFPSVETEARMTEQNNKDRTLGDYLSDLVTVCERGLAGEVDLSAVVNPASNLTGLMLDRRVVDILANLLAEPEWHSAADYLETVADTIGLARPHPGGYATRNEYKADFLAATGRDYIAGDDE